MFSYPTTNPRENSWWEPEKVRNRANDRYHTYFNYLQSTVVVDRFLLASSYCSSFTSSHLLVDIQKLSYPLVLFSITIPATHCYSIIAVLLLVATTSIPFPSREGKVNPWWSEGDSKKREISAQTIEQLIYLYCTTIEGQHVLVGTISEF